MDSTLKVRLHTLSNKPWQLGSYGVVLALPTDDETLEYALEELDSEQYGIEYLTCDLGEVLTSLEENHKFACIHALNYLAERIANLSPEDKTRYQAAILHKECDSRSLYLHELTQLIDCLDQYDFYPDFLEEIDYGAHIMHYECASCDDNSCTTCFEVGERRQQIEDGQFTEHGYICLNLRVRLGETEEEIEIEQKNRLLEEKNQELTDEWERLFAEDNVVIFVLFEE